METVNILGIKINKINMDSAVETAKSYMADGGFHYIFTPNSEIIMAAYKNGDFASKINSADMCTADGIGVVYAAKILGQPVSGRIAGYDLVMRLLEDLPKIGKRAYFFGGAPGVADEAKEKLEKKFPGIEICGSANGYFDAEREKEIIADINEKKPDLLLVCLGFPKQENWIFEHKDELNVGLAMGVGGTLDVIAGRAQRAPDIFIKLGLEWFYRLLKQPSRIGRMMALPKFLFTVIWKKVTKSK
ncbi:MAG: WecB/TagA/CpsF family glycosyltransferase [Bacillota bacterium]|nr:WecB/TagA/CpsF family glycosyltransferase [Bacillota bacterium]